MNCPIWLPAASNIAIRSASGYGVRPPERCITAVRWDPLLIGNAKPEPSAESVPADEDSASYKGWPLFHTRSGSPVLLGVLTILPRAARVVGSSSKEHHTSKHCKD